MTGVSVLLALLRARPPVAPRQDAPRFDPVDSLAAHAPAVQEADLVHLAASILALVTETRGMLAGEQEDRAAHGERRAIAAVTTGRVTLEEAATLPLYAITGAPRLLAWTAALRALHKLDAPSLRRRRRGAWRLVRGLIEVAPLRHLPAEDADDLRCAACAEVDICEAVRPSAGSVAELAGSIDVRARAVGELLVPVLAAVQRGAPMLETGERLRRALAAWEGRA